MNKEISISQKIDAVIRSELQSTLKKEGFLKSSRTFRRKFEICTQIVNIQGSMTNLGENGSFTINLGVYFPEAEILNGLFPVKEKPVESDCLIRQRIGHLMPNHNDFWWELTQSSNLDELAKEINKCWLEYGKPWINKHTSIDQAIEFSLSRKTPYWASIFSLMQNDKEKAQYYLNEALEQTNKNPDFYLRLQNWGKRNELIV